MSQQADVQIDAGRTRVRFDSEGLADVLRAAADWIDAHANEPYSDFLGDGLYLDSVTVTEYDGTYTLKLFVNDEKHRLETEPRP